MKFKSAEADWNTSFVSQHAKGRNWRHQLAGKLYRLGCRRVGVLDGLREWKAGSGEDDVTTYLKFAASFWVSAFLAAASMRRHKRRRAEK
jgi:hypothetical protein